MKILKLVHASFIMIFTLMVILTSCEKEEILIDESEVQLKNYELLTLNTNEIFDTFKKQQGNALILKIPYNDLNLELEEIHIFEEDMKTPFYTIEKDGSEKPLEMPDIHFYGNKKGAEETAFLSVFEDEFRLEFTKEGKSFSIVPAIDFFKDKHLGKYVVYASDELINTNLEIDCFHPKSNDDNISTENLAFEPAKKAGYYKLKVGGVIDYQMYQHYGYNGAVNQVLNQVAGAHQIFANNNMNIDIIWGGGYIDLYNNFNATTETYYSEPFWNQWVSWVNGPGSWSRAWNVDNQFIWTGHWLQNTGAMGQSTACVNRYWACGFMNIRKANSGGWAWKNQVLAHEIGHSLGAYHDSGLMAWNTASGTFSWNSKNQINNHLTWYSGCLFN